MKDEDFFGDEYYLKRGDEKDWEIPGGEIFLETNFNIGEYKELTKEGFIKALSNNFKSLLDLSSGAAKDGDKERS